MSVAPSASSLHMAIRCVTRDHLLGFRRVGSGGAFRFSASTSSPLAEGEAGAAKGTPSPSPDTAAAAETDFLRDGMPANLSGSAHEEARKALIEAILSRDKEVFELKRQHELSMLRVEQHQKRMLKDQEDRGMYYEQNVNVHTFDTISVSLYSQRSTLYHTMNTERLRNFKIFLTVMTTVIFCTYLYYRYIINPEWEYVEQPIKLLGSRVQAVRDRRWKRLDDEGQIAELRRVEEGYKANSRTTASGV